MNLEMTEFQKIFKEVIEGKSLRAIEREYGVNRETIIKKCRDLFPENSKERQKLEMILEYNKNVLISVKIPEEDMKNVARKLFNKTSTLDAACKTLEVDVITFKDNLARYVANSNDKNLMKQYIEYEAIRNPDYSHINFIALLIEMVKSNETQVGIAETYGIPSRTIGREIEKLKNDEYYKDLYDLCKECAYRKEHKRDFSKFELELMGRLLSKYNEGSIIIKDAKTKEERNYERAKYILQITESIDGTQKEKAKQAGISESTLRRMKLFVQKYEEKQEMKKIVEKGEK